MEFIRNIVNKPLFRISSLNSLSVILKIFIGLITSKVIAVFVGPSGMALVGNLRNFISTIETFSMLGFQNGIVKYVAENEKDKQGLKKIISTVFIALMLLSIAISLALFFFSSYWNNEIFGAANPYGIVFKALAVGLPWYVANLIFVAIINGLSKFSKVIYVSIFGNSIGLVVSVVLIWKLHTLGALLSVIITPSLLFLMSYYYINSEIQFLRYVSFGQFDFSIIKGLSSYTLMALASGILGPIVFLAIRNNVIESLGADQAGYWEAVSRISSYYMMFVTTLLSVYFLPKLALSENDRETKGVFLSYFKNIMPVFFLVMIVMFFLRNLIIQILFTKDFEPVSELFFWQLLGDTFKAASLIFGYQLLAKKMTKTYIFTEILSLSTLYFSSFYLIKVFGVEGVVIAHTIEYFVYLGVLFLFFKKQH
ncbi:O-antigen translocase [Flavobacterium sp. SM15]|uniref:O-antigen translocase n=1 Tax=Flavobacterium sp. SM15 TaxID=2908005 RepID=UPI001EDB5C70|nr:O-antigen translocase [Flavobacterium sp. SM15]MCG2611008.1 O-antigen translocase [Flavobacterium sp. SM15]